jgi:hypothetical protein
MRRIVALVLIVLGAAILLGRGHAIASALLGKSRTTTSTIAEPITSIVITTGNGDVHVRDGSTTAIRRTEHWTYSRPHVDVSRSGSELRVSATCPAAVFNRCWVDIDASVPAGSGATVKTHNGDVSVAGLHGRQVTVGTSNGDVQLSNLGGDFLKVTTHNGDVTLDNVSTPIDVQTSNGDVHGSIANKGSTTIVTYNGDVHITVPSGRYATELTTRNGDVSTSGIIEDSSSPDTLSIRTHNGDAKIAGR